MTTLSKKLSNNQGNIVWAKNIYDLMHLPSNLPSTIHWKETNMLKSEEIHQFKTNSWIIFMALYISSGYLPAAMKIIYELSANIQNQPAFQHTDAKVKIC